MFRERNVITEDICESGVTVLALERGGTVQHFVNQNTQRPPIYCTSVTATFNDFWCNVFLCADKGIGAEVVDTGFCIDRWERISIRSIAAQNHCWLSAWVGLLGQVKV